MRKSTEESQEDLAYAIDLNSKGAVANWESGNNRLSPENLKRIAAHYRVNAFMPIQSFDIAIKFIFGRIKNGAFLFFLL